MKILLISHDFPPMQSPEAIRSGKYAKYLNRYGFNLFVLNSERKKGSLIRRAMARYDLIPDACGKWIKPAFKEACEVIEREKIDLIFSRSMPIVSHRVALLVKEKYPEIPWIAEFSDPWTQNIYKRYPFGFGQGRDEAYEEIILNKVDKIITTSDRTANLFLEKYPEIKDKIKAIPNFFDEEEFKGIDNPEMFNQFIVMCTGNFYGGRTPEYLFKALKELEVEKFPISVVLIGNLGKFKKLVKKYNLPSDRLNIIPPVEREKAIDLLKYANAYLLIDAPSRIPSVFLPSKLPEYLYMRRPILALTPEEGTVNDIIRETGTGICVNPENVQGIKTALRELPKLIINTGANIQRYSALDCVWEFALMIKEMIKNKEEDVKDNKCLRSETEFSKDSPINKGL